MGERRRWGITRGRALVLLLLALPRCTCLGGSCFNAGDGCNVDVDGGGCTGNLDSNCPDVDLAGTHTISAVDSLGGCSLQCVSGWSDCDGNPANGCETEGECTGDASSDGGEDAGAKPQLLTTLAGTPRGLAACDPEHVYYFDGDVLELFAGAVDASTPVLAASGSPSGGIACGATNLYWATLSDADAGPPNGSVWSLPFGGDAATALVPSVDPGRGIDVRAPRVYWIARSGFGDGGSMLVASMPDAASVALIPAAESEAYKSFALSYDGDYALAHGSVWFGALGADAGGASALPFDASAASALFAAAGGTYAVVHGAAAVDASADAAIDGGADADASADDASDATVADASDGAEEDGGDGSTADAGDASFDGASDAGIDATVPVTDSIVSLTPWFVVGGFARIVATAGNGTAVVATDDAVYYMDLPTGGVTVLTTSALHVVDVAIDNKYAYWTTRGDGATPGALWRIALP